MFFIAEENNWTRPRLLAAAAAAFWPLVAHTNFLCVGVPLDLPLCSVEVLVRVAVAPRAWRFLEHSHTHARTHSRLLACWPDVLKLQPLLFSLDFASSGTQIAVCAPLHSLLSFSEVLSLLVSLVDEDE